VASNWRESSYRRRAYSGAILISRWRETLGLLERAARAFENGLIVVLLAVLIVLASSQIVLRNVFSTTLSWGDELVRLLVLWLALVGAIAASRDGRQIRIDVLPRMLPTSKAWIPDSLATAFTATVCAFLAWHAWRFVEDSRAYEDVLLGGWPAWLLQLILPIGFAVMAYRYLIRAVGSIVERR